MRRVDEQLRKLATAARAPFTDVRGGFTKWLLDDGEPLPYVGIGATATAENVALYVKTTGDIGGDSNGQIFIGTGDSGATALLNVGNPDDDGTVGGATDRATFRIIGGVMYAPLISCAWQHDPLTALNSTGYASVSSGTYTRCWTAVLPITSGAIRGSVIVDRTGTAVVDARIRIRDYSAGGSPVTLHEETGISSTVFLSGWPWTVPDTVVSPSGDPIGALALLELEVRVASGSGNAVVAPDAPVVNWVG